MSKKIQSLVEAIKYVETKTKNKPLNNLQMKFEDKLKAKLLESKTSLKEAEDENVLKLDTPEASEEINTTTDELPTEVTDETLGTEEIPTDEEDLSHIDLTDNVEEVGDNQFTVPAEVHVELVPGAKVKFTHNDVEYIGTVGDLAPDSDSVYTLEVEPASDLTPAEGEEGMEGLDSVGETSTEEPMDDLEINDVTDETEPKVEEAYEPELQDPGVNKETGIYESLEEGLTMEDLDLMEAIDLQEAGPEDTEVPNPEEGNVPEVTNIEEPNTSDVPEENLETGEEGAVPGEENLEPGMEQSNGEIAVGSSLPAGGTSPELGVSDNTESGMDSSINISPIDEPENVEQLVLELIQTEDVNKLDELAELHSNNPEEVKESDLMLEDTKLPGTTTLKTEEPKIKVAQKKETTTGVAFKKNTELEAPNTKITELGKGSKKDMPASTKLNTKEITGAAPKKTGEEHTTDDLKGGKKIPEGTAEKGTTKFTNKVSDTGKKEATGKTDFSKLKQESVQRVALNELSNKYVLLQEEINKLRLENYKLLKVNGLLTLLPELKVDTREQLVEKFTKCATSNEVLSLYKKVVTLVKEERKPSLNKMILESKSEPKTLDAISNTDEKRRLTESTEVSYEQKRKNALMGLPGYEDSYYEGVE